MGKPAARRPSRSSGWRGASGAPRRGGALRRAGGERGAALVETVLIVPVLLLIVFGIIEFSSAYHDASVIADAARAGGRIASAQARNPDYATNASAGVAAALRTLPNGSPQELWIYRANSQGYPGTGTDFTTCAVQCIKFTWDPVQRDWQATTGADGWNASTHQVCFEPFDEIGVYVKIRHDFVTGLFGATLDLDDHSVFRFEPTPSAVCSST